MTADSEFEQRARSTLEEGVARLDGATRSRLTQARYRALEQLDDAGSAAGFWRRAARSRVLAPAGAMAAVVALTTMLWMGRPDGQTPLDGGAMTAGTFEDMELLADGEALAAMTEEDPEFYEWAAAQDAGSAAAQGS